MALQPPDLILLDIMMPGMDGHQVAARLKGDAATRNIPIIMITALDDRSSRMLGLSAGAEDFLTKPVDRAELCVRVRNLLRLKNYGDYFDKYSQRLEGEVVSRTADLAERTQQAAVLAEQAALLDLAPDAIVVRDMDGRIRFWSRGAEVMYGWPAKEALGRNVHELLNAECSEPVAQIDAILLQHGHWEGESIHHAQDGTRLIAACRWTLQRADEDVPVRVLALETDITRRKQDEAAMELIRQDQLRFKDEFLSHVSHELRSPLTAIKQFTSILLGGLAGDLNNEQREYQEIVLKNIRQLQAMIDDLLEVTRLENGQLTIEPERVSVTEAVADTVKTFQEAARLKGITVSCSLPPDLPPALADRTRLRQILIILLDNAIKFTADVGGVSIEARLLQQDPRFLLIEVSDAGCGINPEISERIFERLYQVPETQATRKGLGLGLYICKQLVTRQGGRIWVKSRPKGGSTFSFTLPVCAPASPDVPVLTNGKWPAESVALVMVEICFLDAWPSKAVQQEWSEEARSLLHRSLQPDMDLLLSQKNATAEGERFCFVAGVIDEKGASALADRIRDQFERLPHLQQTRLTVSASYSMLRPFSHDAGTSMNSIVTTMATNLEESIKSHIISEAV